MPIAAADLELAVSELNKQLNLPAYDLLLTGDGSGTTIQTACGFACFMYYPQNKQYSIQLGCFNHGTNNLAELMPYIHALWKDSYINMKWKPRNVEIVSDSELTVRQGNKVYARNANKTLWAAIDSFCDNGYTIHWNHVLRNSNPISALCDKLAGTCRKKMFEFDLDVTNHYDMITL